MVRPRLWRERCGSVLFQAVVGLAVWGMVCPPPAVACVYLTKVAKFYRAVTTWSEDMSASNLIKLCNSQDSICRKFEGAPGKPTPPLPAGAVCGGGGGGGGAGRGGGPGGGGSAGTGSVGGLFGGPIGPPGEGPFPTVVFIRNHHPFDCVFDWEITADAGNPAGFSVSPTSGSVLVPAGGTVTVPIEATIGGGVTPGEIAFFDVRITDTCAVADVADDFSRFRVAATSDVSIVPVTPLLVFASGSPFTVSFEVTNHSASPVTKSFAFVGFPDPQSIGALNDGMPYPIGNLFPDGPGSPSSGMVSLDPGETVEIDCGPIVNGEFCDPQMINCKGIEIDGNRAVTVICNDEQAADNTLVEFFDLVGEAQGGFLQIDIQRGLDNFFVQIPTAPGEPIPLILDQLALQSLNQISVQPGFRFMPVIDERGMTLLHSPDSQVSYQSFDPGLQWIPADFFGGNSGPDLLFLNGSNGGVDRRVDVGTGQPITVQLDAPQFLGPAPSEYFLYVHPGAPAPNGLPFLVNAGPFYLGHTALPSPFDPGQGSPQPIFCLRSAGLPSVVCGNAREKPAPPAIPWSVTKNGGIGNPIELTLQAIVENPNAPSAAGLSVTNAVILNVQ